MDEKTGKLSIRIKATKEFKSNCGCELASYELGSLDENSSFDNIDKTIDLKIPSSGYYYIKFLLSEYKDNDYAKMDVEYFKKKFFFGKTVEIIGPTSYNFLPNHRI